MVDQTGFIVSLVPQVRSAKLLFIPPNVCALRSFLCRSPPKKAVAIAHLS